MKIVCKNFREWQRNTLRGLAEIELSDLGLKIKDIALHEKNSARWAQLPAKPMLKDGAIVKDDQGKGQYVPIL
jgi:hypothetical protein